MKTPRTRGTWKLKAFDRGHHPHKCLWLERTSSGRASETQRQSSDRKNLLSQETVELTTEKRNRVMMRATDPTQLEREIIWPATLATRLTWTAEEVLYEDKAARSRYNLAMRSSVALIVPSRVLR